MKQVWQATDGMTFESKEECQEYEDGMVQMWGIWGSRDIQKTNDFEEASIIYVPNTAELTYDMEDEGIDDVGVWVWDVWCEKFKYWKEIVDVYTRYQNFLRKRSADEIKNMNLDYVDEYEVVV